MAIGKHIGTLSRRATFLAGIVVIALMCLWFFGVASDNGNKFYLLWQNAVRASAFILIFCSLADLAAQIALNIHHQKRITAWGILVSMFFLLLALASLMLIYILFQLAHGLS